MLIDRTLENKGLAAQRHEHLVQMPYATRLAPGGLDAMGEPRTELVAPAADRLMADDHAALEQQLLNVTQAELEAEIP